MKVVINVMNVMSVVVIIIIIIVIIIITHIIFSIIIVTNAESGDSWKLPRTPTVRISQAKNIIV